MSLMDRRKFLKIAGMTGVAASGMVNLSLLNGADNRSSSPIDLAVVQNGNPGQL